MFIQAKAVSVVAGIITAVVGFLLGTAYGRQLEKDKQSRSEILAAIGKTKAKQKPKSKKGTTKEAR